MKRVIKNIWQNLIHFKWNKPGEVGVNNLMTYRQMFWKDSNKIAERIRSAVSIKSAFLKLAGIKILWWRAKQSLYLWAYNKYFYPERWQSGWMRRSWKPLRMQVLPGFESLTLRIVKIKPRKQTIYEFSMLFLIFGIQ